MKASGPMGDQVARMVRKLREEQRVPYTELSERLTKLGRPIPVLGLRRIERGERRVDVDDLVALARALGTFPARLASLTEGVATPEIYPGVTMDTVLHASPDLPPTLCAERTRPGVPIHQLPLACLVCGHTGLLHPGVTNTALTHCLVCELETLRNGPSTAGTEN